MFFKSSSSGLGGCADDAEVIDNLIKEMCTNEDIGIRMYDTSTQIFTLLSPRRM